MERNQATELVHNLLRGMISQNASDLFVTAGFPPAFKVDGKMTPVSSQVLTAQHTQELARSIMNDRQAAEFESTHESNFAINPPGIGRFRVNVFMQQQRVGMVLRTITTKIPSFEDLNLPPILKEVVMTKRGLVILVGGTGSGKSTTLAAMIGHRNHNSYGHIITIEDPVEYQLPGVLQIPVNERKGLSFARGLRSILRHDPDKIMIGEIRDAETAQIAVQAALTGHLVFSTVHANNVFDVLGRFEHMQVDPYSLVSALNGIVAQRLVRVTCPHCAIDLPADNGETLATRRRGQGCTECRGTGYRGRKAIGECLLLDDELREMIATRTPIRHIKEAARARGTRLLRESAEELVRTGVTTLEEINRVTFAR